MAPENTRPAFDFALRHQADVLEVDVRLSRDRELIVIHDATLDRTTNGNGQVADHHATDIGRLDGGYRFRYEKSAVYPFRGQDVRIYTLDELLVFYPDTKVNIDIKDNSTLAVDRLAKSVGKNEAKDRVVVASFHHNVLSDCRERFPWLITSASKKDVQQFYWRYLCGVHAKGEFHSRRFQLPVSYAIFSLSNPRFINSVHRAGSYIDFWTINDARVIRKLVLNGADGIVTDRADIASVAIVNALREKTDR